MTEIKDIYNAERPAPSGDLLSLDVSTLKDKLAEAIELCQGDPDCLVRVNQVLSEASDLCLKAITHVDSESTQ